MSVQFDLWPECLLNFLFTSFHSLTYGPTPRGSGSLPQSFSSASAPSTSLYRTGSRTTCPSNTWTSPRSSPSSSPSTSSPSWTPSPCAGVPRSPGTGGFSLSRSVLRGARHHTGITLKENCLFFDNFIWKISLVLWFYNKDWICMNWKIIFCSDFSSRFFFILMKTQNSDIKVYKYSRIYFNIYKIWIFIQYDIGSELMK